MPQQAAFGQKWTREITALRSDAVMLRRKAIVGSGFFISLLVLLGHKSDRLRILDATAGVAIVGSKHGDLMAGAGLNQRMKLIV